MAHRADPQGTAAARRGQPRLLVCVGRAGLDVQVEARNGHGSPWFGSFQGHSNAGTGGNPFGSGTAFDENAIWT